MESELLILNIKNKRVSVVLTLQIDFPIETIENLQIEQILITKFMGKDLNREKL